MNGKSSLISNLSCEIEKHQLDSFQITSVEDLVEEIAFLQEDYLRSLRHYKQRPSLYSIRCVRQRLQILRDLQSVKASITSTIADDVDIGDLLSDKICDLLKDLSFSLRISRSPNISTSTQAVCSVLVKNAIHLQPFSTLEANILQFLNAVLLFVLDGFLGEPSDELLTSFDRVKSAIDRGIGTNCNDNLDLLPGLCNRIDNALSTNDHFELLTSAVHMFWSSTTCYPWLAELRLPAIIQRISGQEYAHSSLKLVLLFQQSQDGSAIVCPAPLSAQAGYLQQDSEEKEQLVVYNVGKSYCLECVFFCHFTFVFYRRQFAKYPEELFLQRLGRCLYQASTITVFTVLAGLFPIRICS